MKKSPEIDNFLSIIFTNTMDKKKNYMVYSTLYGYAYPHFSI